MAVSRTVRGTLGLLPNRPGESGFVKPGNNQDFTALLQALIDGSETDDTQHFNIRDARWAGGAKGDGASDDSAAFAAAEAAAFAAGGVVFIPRGTFMALALSTRVPVYGPGTLKMKVQPATLGAQVPLLTVAADDVSLEGVTFDGNKANQTFAVQDSDKGRTHGALVALASCSRTTVSGCHFRNSVHDAIASASSGVEGVPNTTVNGLVVTGCTFKDCISGAVEFFGIPPPDGTTTLTSGGFVFTGNYLKNMGALNPNDGADTHMYGDCLTFGWLTSANVTGNVFEECKRAAVKCGTVLSLTIAANDVRNSFWQGMQCAQAAPGWASGAAWVTATGYLLGAYVVNGGRAYKSQTDSSPVAGLAVTSGATPPTHTGGTAVTDGAIVWLDLGVASVDYKGAISITGNTFDGCANASGADPTVGGAIYINGSATFVNWKSGLCKIAGNTIINCPSNGAQPRDAIYIAGAAHYRKYDVSNNEIIHASRHGINFECFNIAAKESARIRDNQIDVSGNTVTAAGIVVSSDNPMTSGNRLLLLDIGDNTIRGAVNCIKLVNDPARNVRVRGNGFIASSQEAFYWGDTVTPLSCFIEDNDWLEMATVAMLNAPNVSNVWVGDNNRGLNTAGFMTVGGTAPAGFKLASAAPTTGWWRRGDRVLNTAPSSGGYVGWVCTTAGWANATAWAGSGSYTLNDYVNKGGYVYQCSTAGTNVDSGSGPSRTTAGTDTSGPITWTFVGVLAVFKTYGPIS